MAEAGILAPDERVELLDGEVVQMSPIGPRHAGGVRRIYRALSRRVGDRALVDVQNPIRLGNRVEPQPDVALLRPRDDLYLERHPDPGDVLLVIEVADTSAAYDRGTKLPMYARAGIPEAWLADWSDRRRPTLEVHRDRSPDGYRDVRRLGRGERVALLALPDVELAVDELLGR